MKIISVDVEEWYHLLYLDAGEDERLNRLESRLAPGIDQLLDVFEQFSINATFFTLGSVAGKHPSVIQKINNAGHEIASHGHFHDLLPKKPTPKFGSELKASIDILEQITGKKVRSYRAPGFSITKENLWIFEVLMELGIERDSSIIIGKSHHGGWSECQENTPFRLQLNGGIIKEFPINTHRILGRRMIFGGGGYFRFFPYPLIKNWTANASYAMAYFHYKDFDPGQPRLKNLTFLEQFRAYYGIDSSFKKFRRYLNDFEFTGIDQADKNTDWDTTKTIDLKNYCRT